MAVAGLDGIPLHDRRKERVPGDPPKNSDGPRSHRICTRVAGGGLRRGPRLVPNPRGMAGGGNHVDDRLGRSRTFGDRLLGFRRDLAPEALD